MWSVELRRLFALRKATFTRKLHLCILKYSHCEERSDVAIYAKGGRLIPIKHIPTDMLNAYPRNDGL